MCNAERRWGTLRLFTALRRLRGRGEALIAAAILGAGAAVGAPTVELELNSYITNWLLLGPFPNRVVEGESGGTNRMGFYTDYLKEIGGESAVALSKATRVPGHVLMEPTNVVSIAPEIDLDAIYGMPDLVVGYAYVNVRVPRETTAYLHVGSDDGVRVWLDGMLVIDTHVERGYLADENWARVRLSRGTHRLLVKVEDAFGAWKFSLRFVDEAVHHELIARQIRKELLVELMAPTGAGERVKARLDTVPSVTDFPVRIVGRWIGADGVVTQMFDAVLGAAVALPDELAGAEKVRLEAWAAGVPRQQPQRAVNVYSGAMYNVATAIAARAAQVLGMLTQTDTTARLAQRHEGIIKLNLDLARQVADVPGLQCPIEIHQALTDVEDILGVLEQGGDYLGGLTGSYRAAYVSRVDGSAQPFMISVPPASVPGMPMPLMVILHDAGEEYSSEFTRAPQLAPCLTVRVHGRGLAGGYVGLSGVDVLEVVEYVTNNYLVDPDRIYLIGSGMGGYGAWMLASRHPEIWGGVLTMGAYSADVPLANLRNVAVRVVHGDRDQITPVEYSRAASDFLITRAFPAVYDEMKDAGYRLQGAAEPLRVFEWLLNHRREQGPREVQLHGLYWWNTRAHWLAINARRTPKSGARAHGRFVGANELVLYLDNVAEAEIDLPSRFVDDESLLSVICNGKNYEMSAPLPPRIWVRYDGERAVLLRQAPAQDSAVRPYAMGSWQHFYTGEPVLIVRGTSGSEEMTAALAACAQRVQRWSFPGREMSRGGFAVRADKDVTRDDMERYHLILLGGRAENSVVAMMADQLGAALGERSVTIGGTEESLAGRGMWLCQVNPLAPQRLVWIWASPDPAFYDATAPWIQDWIFPVVNPPDLLIVQREPQRYVRALHFDCAWQIDADELLSPQLSEIVRPPEFLARVLVRALQSLVQSDYVWVGDHFRQLVQQMSRLRAAEAATLLLRHSTVFVCEIRGADLKQLQARVAGIPDGPQLLPAVFDVQPDRIYKIAVTPRGLRSLSQAAKGTLRGASYHEVAIRRTFRSMIDESLAF